VHTQFSTYPPVGVVLPAGGIGSRFGQGQPKQFCALAGVPILARTCQAFLELPEVSSLALALPRDHYQAGIDLLQEYLSPPAFVRLLCVVGGATRQESVQAGVTVLPPEVEIVLVHDAARPLVDRQTILRCVQGAFAHGAVIAAVPVKDTLKEVDHSAEITRTIDRSRLWQAQTPQAARRALLQQAFDQAAEQGFVGTDEASLLEAARIPVHVVEGSERNLKVTRPEDLQVAEALIRDREEMKIGHGYDAHRLVSGRQLILGGVDIPHELGLDGHSDADVVAHALTDAILGALGLGDIGRHFPDSDPQFKGADSLVLLAHVQQLAQEKGYQLGNGDITIVCQRPKLAPYLAAMQENLARVCKVQPEAINIKATTTEKMGYTGRGEGIATYAVVLMRSEHGRQ
jgi:2-C-methyl-D-erythritol 4-phosphate cytidylyltransferase/2-C-methyl-D-erythritol 2,4-cyclodiphosphate synthase